MQPGDGHRAGQGEGEHALEVDVTLDELARSSRSCSPTSSAGTREDRRPEDQVHRGQHHRPRVAAPLQAHLQAGAEAADREGTYDPARPIIVPTREDRRYRSYKLQELPETNAVIIYMMDVSGSMGDEQKEIVRIESFWLDTWLRHSTRAWRPATSSTTRWRARWTATPSSTPASPAGR